jgi:ABC-type uncharacterized transport system substrate-binding protein
VETLEAYFRFSLEQNVPLVTFAGQYLEKGAFAAIEADRLDMGRLVGEQIRNLLDHRSDSPTVVEPRKVRLSTNPSIGKKLGISTAELERAVRTTGE